MLEDDIVVVTKQTVATTSDSRHYDESKGKRGRDELDIRDELDPRDTGRTSHHIKVRDRDRATENPRQNNSMECTSPTCWGI